MIGIGGCTGSWVCMLGTLTTTGSCCTNWYIASMCSCGCWCGRQWGILIGMKISKGRWMVRIGSIQSNYYTPHMDMRMPYIHGPAHCHSTLVWLSILRMTNIQICGWSGCDIDSMFTCMMCSWWPRWNNCHTY